MYMYYSYASIGASPILTHVRDTVWVNSKPMRLVYMYFDCP